MSDDVKLPKFKNRPSGWGARRVESRAVAPKITTIAKTSKSIGDRHVKAKLARIEPPFTEPDPTYTFKAKDLYAVRQVGSIKNWEDTVFTKTFAIAFHRSIESLPNPEQGYAICIKDLIARKYEDLSSYGMFMGIELRHKDLEFPILLPYIPIHRINDTIILEQLAFLRDNAKYPKAISSNEFEIDLRFVKQLRGSGVKSEPKYHLEKFRKGVTPNNVSQFCLPVAILQGICYLDHMRDPKDEENLAKWREFQQIDDDFVNTKEMLKVEELLKAAGLEADGELKSENYTIEDVRAIQNHYFHQYQIVVFAENNNKKPVMKGNSIMGKNIIPLVCKDGHFQHINNVPKFVEKKYYCIHCEVAYCSLLHHYNCPLRCRLCNLAGCVSDDSEIICPNCKMTFYSKQCEINHRKPIEGNITVCGSTLYCESCQTPYRKYKGHECNVNYCTHCRINKPKGHSCVMSDKKCKQHAITQKLIFVHVKYEMVETEDGVHQNPILAMALKCCKDCKHTVEGSLKKGMNSTCNKCSKESNRFFFCSSIRVEEEENDVLGELFNFLFSKQHEKSCVVFHEMPECVNEYLLEYVTNDGNQKPKKLLMSEGKWKCLKFNGSNIRIVDCYSLFPFRLRKLAKSIGVSSSYSRIPQSLLRTINLNSNSTLPNLDVFLEEADCLEEVEEIKRYYKKLEEKPFVLLDELLRSTYSELILLTQSVLKVDSSSFASLGIRFVEETEELLSSSLLAYRRSYFTDGVLTLDIGLGSRFHIASSFQAMEYLAWRSYSEGLPIDSSMNVGEYRLPGTPYYSDGFIHPCEKYPRGLAIEIHGCYWHAHGCSYLPKMVPRRELDIPKITRQDTTKKAVFEQFHEFEVIWECKVAELRRVKEIVEFLENFVYEGPVDIWASIYPPRTETFLHQSENDNEREIRICDISDISGKILKEGDFPLCEMRRIHGEFFKTPIRTPQELRAQVKGIIYCQVLAPSSLEIPVLPDNIYGNISYPLCRGCLENSSEFCYHSEEEQILTGTWTSFELELALEQGYVITRIIGAIHWDKWRRYQKFEDGKEEHSIFSNFADALLQMQAESEKTLNEVSLNTSKAFMKLTEIFGHRSDHPTTKILQSREELWKILDDPTMLVWEIKTSKKDKLVVSAGNKKVAIDAAGDKKVLAKPIDTTVSIVPALVGGQKRVKIHRALIQEDCEPLYIDGNYVVYRCPKGMRPLKSLGEDIFTHERIHKFWSNGPGRFTVEFESEEVFTHGPGFERKGKAFLARAAAVKEQTVKLVEGSLECVEIEHLSIRANSQHILKTERISSLIHLSSAYQRRIEENGRTIPIGFLW